MDEYLKRCLKDTELVMVTERYSLYVNKDENTVHIYSGDDICEIPMNSLGDLLFE